LHKPMVWFKFLRRITTEFTLRFNKCGDIPFGVAVFINSWE
jgi:hypothetical protein